MSRLTSGVVGMPSGEDLNTLSLFAVESRYPDDLPDIGEDEAEWAIETAEAVLAAVRAARGG